MLNNHRDSKEIYIATWLDSDLPAEIDLLIEEAIQDGHSWAADFNAAWTKRPFIASGEALLLGRQDGQLVAMAVISADPFVSDRITGRLRFIYVRPAARRQGIADRLVTQCISIAREHWAKLRLHTDNPAASRIYKRHGFNAVSGEERATHIRLNNSDHEYASSRREPR